MVECGFDITAAARRTGLYSDSYINGDLRQSLAKDQWFQGRLKRMRDRNLKFNKDKTEALDTLVDDVIDSGEYCGQPVSPSVLCKLVELRYRRLNAFAAGHTDEDTDRKALTPAQLRKAREQSLKLIKQLGQGKAG
jgi:hypothetical protein